MARPSPIRDVDEPDAEMSQSSLDNMWDTVGETLPERASPEWIQAELMRLAAFAGRLGHVSDAVAAHRTLADMIGAMRGGAKPAEADDMSEEEAEEEILQAARMIEERRKGKAVKAVRKRKRG